VQAAACPDYPDHQEPQERTVAPDALEYPVPLDSPDAHHQCAKSPHHLHADPAHLDPPDHRDPPEDLEPLAAPDPLVAMETMELPVPPDPRDPLDLEETLDATDSLETPEPPLSLSPSSLETRDHKEISDHRVFLETQVPLVPMDSPATPDPRDLPDPLDLRDLLATMDSPDPVDPLDLRENAVFAPNIALWTVEFSSKMEQGDKQSAGQIFFYFFLVFSTILCSFRRSDASFKR
jgi:hypothetical protein